MIENKYKFLLFGWKKKKSEDEKSNFSEFTTMPY